MTKMGIAVAVVVLIMLVMKFRGSTGQAEVAREKIRNGALILDVRTPGEYQGGHIEGALNIPVQELDQRLTELKDKHQAIVVYCASGVRSGRAVSVLQKAGYTDVTDAGGIGNLK